MPPRSRAFVTAAVASIFGIAGLAVGGYGIDLVFLHRPDFSLATLLAMPIVGTVAWFVGAVVAWRRAHLRPPTSRGDVALFLVGAACVMWLGVQAANEVRLAHFGPMIDEIGPRHGLLPIIATTYVVSATLVALTFIALALTRDAPTPRRTVR